MFLCKPDLDGVSYGFAFLINYSRCDHGEDNMAKLVMKESKKQNYVILAVLIAVFVYLIFLR
jgi:hypothetical protein